jgi:hypothetical protein
MKDAEGEREREREGGRERESYSDHTYKKKL